MQAYDISIVVPGMEIRPDILETESLGGSETAGLCAAAALADLGHRVKLFCNGPGGALRNLDLVPLDHWNAYARIPHDITIVQRHPPIFASGVNARLRLLWCHDLATGRAFEQINGVLWNLDRILVLSEFMKAQYRKVYDLPEHMLEVTRNGIDLSLFPEPAPPGKRYRKRLVYAARPERGVDVLLDRVFPAVLERDPEFELLILGYDNVVDEMRPFYQEIAEKCARFGDRVRHGGFLNKQELYRVYATSGIYVYPCPSPTMPNFAEVSCISLMEAQAAGLPVVASDRGAVSETLADGAGVLIPGDPASDDAVTGFVDAILDLAGSDDRYAEAQKHGTAKAKTLGWRDLAIDWSMMFDRLMTERSSDPARVAQHFRRTGSTAVAGTCGFMDPVRKHELDRLEDMNSDIVRQWLRSRPQLTSVAVESSGWSIDHGIAEVTDEADAAVSMCTIQRADDPCETLRALEKKARPGGWVLVSVPWGGADAEQKWDLDLHDLHDMLHRKSQMDVQTVAVTDSEITGLPMGLHLFSYMVDAAPVGDIDRERKARLQAPRETVSASLIVGGAEAEDTLGWCLRSIRPHVDQLVIGDCGMTADARRIAKKYGAEFVKAPNPLEAGFDAARNATLDRCIGDWVLWLDADERLVDARNVAKYLRPNVYDAYGLRQHHFACDTVVNPDLPSRLFRRRRQDNKEMRWVGRIHEHPETGLNEGPGRCIVLNDVHVAHVGYLTESIRRIRFKRNHPLLHKDIEDYPDRLIQKYLIMRDDILLCSHEMQQNGGKITPEIREWAREARDLYREHFLGRETFMGADALNYYSQALSILGEGFEVSFDVRANKDGVGEQLNGGTHARFASEDEVMQTLKKAVHEKVFRFESEYW